MRYVFAFPLALVLICFRVIGFLAAVVFHGLRQGWRTFTKFGDSL